MPITIKHDVPFAQSAGLAALAGSAMGRRKQVEAQLDRSAAMSQTAARIGASRDMQMQQLSAAADMQHERISASAEQQQAQFESLVQRDHAQAEYAKDRIALSAGLGSELQDQKFSQAMEGMQQQAKVQADQWEWKYDVSAKKRMVEWDKAIDYFNTSPDIDDADRKGLVEYAQNAKYGIEQSPHRKEPQPSDTVPEAFKNGQMAQFPNGAWGHYEQDRSTGEFVPKIDIKPSETLEYKKAEAQIKELDARQKRIEKVREFRYDLSQTRDEETGKILGGLEIDRKTLERFGGQVIAEFRGQDLGRTQEQPEPTQEQLEGELQQRIDAQQAEDVAIESAIREPTNMWAWMRAWDVKLTSEEEKLPRNEGHARAFARELRKRQKAGQEVSADMVPAIKESFLIIQREKSYAKDR